MKKFFSIISIIIILPIFLQGQATRDTEYSVIDVYTDPDIVDGSEIQVIGYYTDDDYNYLIEFYGDFDKDEPYAPHTVLTMTGVLPPAEAWNGGFILVSGIVTFVDVPTPYYAEDSLMAFLDATSITVIVPGDGASMSPGGELKEDKKKNESGGNRSPMNGDCDPCKFAFLLSGGVGEVLTEDGTQNINHSKYWENLAALYKFKVDSLGYCDSNVFVHYYDGTPRDPADIPADRVRAADSTLIDSSFQVIADRVAVCNDNGTPATFQKMVTNHGASDGDICLLGNSVLQPGHLKDLQQKVIDSCCRTVYDEFLQCYGGFAVDEMASLDDKNKATIYINSNADHQSGHSPHDQVHPYLEAKIATLDTGGAYADAVVNGKLAYDNYLQQKINHAHNMLVMWRAKPADTPGRGQQITYWTNDSTSRAGKICTSRNVTIVPFTHYCESQTFVVPPGGQLVLNFTGNNTSCGNVTVYQIDPATGDTIKTRVFNWNNPGSYGYQPGFEQRVIHGDDDGITTFKVHNDNDTSRLVVESLGSQVHPVEDTSNVGTFPGFSFGWRNGSSLEFDSIMIPTYFYEGADQLGISLTDFPSTLGPGYVQQFGFSFQIDPTNLFWSEMELILNVNSVSDPDDLVILSPSGTMQEVIVPILGPDTYVIPLGDFTVNGDAYGVITMIPTAPLLMELDSWGLRSTYGYPEPPTTTWLGLVSENWTDPANWSYGVPGPYHHVIVTPGESFQPRIELDVSIWTITIMEGAIINTAPGAILMVNGQ